MTDAEMIAELRALYKEATPGEWQAKHFPETRDIIDGVLEPTGRMKRSIFAVRHDEHGHRITQVLLDVFEQAAHIGEGEVNINLIAASHNHMPTLLRLAEQWLKMREALLHLVQLKDHKTMFGQDVDYKREQPIAWENARKALSCQTDGEGS